MHRSVTILFVYDQGYNLYKATKAFQNKEYLDSIYFETFAMSLFMRFQFYANKIIEAEHHMPTEGSTFVLILVRIVTS